MEKENGEQEKESDKETNLFSKLNPSRNVKSILMNNQHRKTQFIDLNVKKTQKKKIEINLITSSVLLGYNKLRSLNGLEDVLDKVVTYT